MHAHTPRAHTHMHMHVHNYTASHPPTHTHVHAGTCSHRLAYTHAFMRHTRPHRTPTNQHARPDTLRHVHIPTQTDLFLPESHCICARMYPRSPRTIYGSSRGGGWVLWGGMPAGDYLAIQASVYPSPQSPSPQLLPPSPLHVLSRRLPPDLMPRPPRDAELSDL